MSELEHLSEQLAVTGLYEPQQGSLIYAELAAYAEGLELYFGKLEELLRELFLSSAQSYGLDIRSTAFRSADFAATAGQKRTALMKAMSVNTGDFNLAGMEKVRDSFGVSGTFSYDHEHNKLTLTLTTSMSASERARLESSMARMMPCWVTFEIAV